MDDPSNSQCCEAQFFQQAEEENETVSLRDAVMDMQGSGSCVKVVQFVTGFIMTQMSAKAGIKKHGQVALDALFQEILQLHDLDFFNALVANDITKEQKRGALRAISVIKEKRCGKRKGRTVADGRPQKALYTKDETTSPMISTDALMMSIMIDAWERRDVVTADVAGAYLHAEFEDFVILRMEGESVDIMCRVNERYKHFVVYENGKKVLYL
jgi:hypothetical protein